MTALFADTFYWIALADFSDNSHKQALDLTAAHAADAIVTTDEVLTEYLTFFAATPEAMRREAAISVRNILASPAIRVIPQSRASFLAGLDLYIQRPDKGYSLTDCISMQTMRRESLTDVLTNDRHFEQEGFRALFR
jgi:predicted nucleic acid-binding protein